MREYLRLWPPQSIADFARESIRVPRSGGPRAGEMRGGRVPHAEEGTVLPAPTFLGNCVTSLIVYGSGLPRCDLNYGIRPSAAAHNFSP